MVHFFFRCLSEPRFCPLRRAELAIKFASFSNANSVLKLFKIVAFYDFEADMGLSAVQSVCLLPERIIGVTPVACPGGRPRRPSCCPSPPTRNRYATMMVQALLLLPRLVVTPPARLVVVPSHLAAVRRFTAPDALSEDCGMPARGAEQLLGTMSTAPGRGKSVQMCSATRYSDREEEAAQIMQSFVEMTAPILQEIQLAWDAQDFQGLRDAAHSLKGGARSACCTPLADAAEDLQEAAVQGRVNMPHISKIWRCFTEVEQAVRSL